MPAIALAASLASLALAQLRAADAAQSTPAIRSVVIRRAPIFDSVEARFWGYRLINAIHADTRAYVVRRELLFRPGEPYDTARVNESARNLRALGLFRDVEIDSVATDSGLVVRVATIDGWTTEMGFGISTSGSQSVLSAFIAERNLFGTATIATVGYVSDPDRRSVLAGVDFPRVIVNRIGFGVSYLDRTDGRAGGASIRYPFLNLSSRGGGSLSGQFVDARVLRFVGGRGRAVDSLRRRFEIVRGEAAFALSASPRGFVHLGLAGQVRRDDFADEEAPRASIPRTVTAALGPFVSMRVPRFIQVRNIEAFGRTEDVDLGLRVRAGALAAPRAWGYERDGVGGALGIGIGRRLPLGYIQLHAGATGLRSSDGLDSASVDASATLFAQSGDRHLLVAHAGAARLRNPYPGAEFDLGLGYAARAFPAHAFTGNRRILLNAEYRWLTLPDVLGLVGVGVAGFVDHAGAWFSGSPRRTGTDAGVGLRIGPLRAASASVGRLDFAYRWANDVHAAGWVVSIGRGFVFQRF